MTARRTIAVAVLLIGCTCQAAAIAQTVYRCGNAYSAAPCPQAKAIDADDARTGAQRDEALRLAAEERRRGDDMERSRLRREAEIRPALASALSSAPKPAATAAAEKKAPKHRKAKPPKERRLAVVASAATRPKKK
jgi:hypothetical protein